MSLFTRRIASFISNFLRSEGALGQAGQGRREADKGSARACPDAGARAEDFQVSSVRPSGSGGQATGSCVTRRRLTEDAEMRRARRTLRAVGCVVVAMGLLPVAAHASIPIYAFNTQPSSTQAGAHPDISFSFEVGNRQQAPSPCGCLHDSRTVTVHLPTGLIGNTSATPKCTVAQFASRQCPTDSQLGVEEAKFSDSQGETSGLGTGSFLAPVYNLVPPPEEPALLGFEAGYVNAPIFIDISARTNSDYGVDSTVYNIDHFTPLHSSRTIIWGVPAAPIHDYLRFALGQRSPESLGLTTQLCSATGTPATDDPASAYQFCNNSGEVVGPVARYAGETAYEEEEGKETYPHGIPSNSPETPFFQNPTTCGESSLLTSLDILGYEGETSEADSPYPATTECSQLSFNPSQAIEPTTATADSPSGAEFRLTVPQFESPSVPSPSELKAAVVTLPEGFSLAPNVTNGKTTCSDAEAKFGTTEEAECPEDSKIGTISVETPVLPGVLPGAVYLGEPKPGNRFRMILAFNGFGVHVKLPGTVTPNPRTGQIVIAFENLPQAPFAYFNMHIFGSERGPLDTPTQCGSYEVKSEWTPWDSALSDQTSRQSFTIDEGPNGTPCPGATRPFHPGFQAASTANTAGAHTAFSLNLTREDGEQDLSSLKVTTPPGFSATLKGVSYCPEASIAAAALETHTGLAEQADPSCPASSLVGEFTAGAGPGTHPLYLPGKVYLAGPYQGAPLSFVFITPAVSGGYDLGNVVVREGLDVNPETAQVSTAGAALPQIFQGIPLRLRSLLVNLNRPGFALNPTDCNPLEVTAEVFGSEGAISAAKQHFQVANCATLAFAPKLSMRFTGSTKRAGNPSVHADISYPGGGSYANISRAVVTLPLTELVDNAHINTPCTRVQFGEGKVPGERCPAGSDIGFAKATTPLLEKPLEGPVYLRTGGGHKLPDIVAALNGQIDIALDGHVDQVKGGIRTTFETVPDAPVSNFSLTLDGGNKGLLQNNTNLCVHTLHVTADISGQNGKTANQNPVLSTPCAKKKRKGHRASRVHKSRRAH
jgi:hypothetical protein